MKKKELDQFKKQSIESVDKELLRLKEKLNETKIEIITGKESNLRITKGIRRDIAQLLTIKTIMGSSKEVKEKQK